MSGDKIVKFTIDISVLTGAVLSFPAFMIHLLLDAFSSYCCCRLIHPLSPRGKLVYRGLEGLEASNRLIDAACQATALEESTSSSSIILSDTIWRVAQNPKHVQQLQETAERFPEFGTWIDSPLHLPESTLGALKLTNGCRVIHVPSYLQGLWKHCQEMAHNCQVSLQWNQLPSSESSSSSDNTSKTLQSELESFDTVILSAGSAIFQDYLPSPEPEHKDQIHVFPIHLVRGQSIEFQRQSPSDNEEENDIPDSSSSSSFSDALLCGKYISPLPGPPGHRVLVGATHEFQKEAASSETVLDDMQRATEFMAPELWQESGEYRVDRMTLGYRVQSQRGAHGRLPLIGKLTLPQFLPNHENTWIYTGLSSRGLLYHALFADILVDAAWCKNEALLEEKYPELQWWKKDG